MADKGASLDLTAAEEEALKNCLGNDLYDSWQSPEAPPSSEEVALYESCAQELGLADQLIVEVTADELGLVDSANEALARFVECMNSAGWHLNMTDPDQFGYMSWLLEAEHTSELEMTQFETDSNECEADS